MVSESVLPNCGHDAPGLLETWAMIEQAKATLMARYRCGLEGAFGLLRRAFRAANGGSPAHRNWYYNLKAHPQITVEAGTQTLTVVTTRQFPLFLLTRQDSPEETAITAQSPDPSITAETVPRRRDALTANPSPARPRAG